MSDNNQTTKIRPQKTNQLTQYLDQTPTAPPPKSSSSSTQSPNNTYSLCTHHKTIRIAPTSHVSSIHHHPYIYSDVKRSTPTQANQSRTTRAVPLLKTSIENAFPCNILLPCQQPNKTHLLLFDNETFEMLAYITFSASFGAQNHMYIRFL